MHWGLPGLILHLTPITINAFMNAHWREEEPIDSALSETWGISILPCLVHDGFSWALETLRDERRNRHHKHAPARKKKEWSREGGAVT